MKIGIYQREVPPEDGGAFTFESEVLAELARRQTRHEFVILCHKRSTLPLKQIVLKANKVRSAINVACLSLNRPALFDEGARLRRQGIDLVYSASPYLQIRNIPYFVTCWDLQHRLQPYFPEVSLVPSALSTCWHHREWLFNDCFLRASNIITGTEVGKKEIVHFFRVAPERVHVIPFFAPPNLTKVQSTRPSWLPNGRFLLYPAQFWPHKNHATLVEAFSRICAVDGYADLNLVLPGADKTEEFGTWHKIKELSSRLGVCSRTLQPGFVSDGELRWLYENAAALTFASYFGPDNLPPLEALQLGCPVIASDVNGAREQLGDACKYVLPGNVDDWVTAIFSIFTNVGEKDLLVSRGKKLVRERTTASYIDGLEALFDAFETVRRCW